MTETDKINLRKTLRNLCLTGAIVFTIGILCFSCSDLHVQQDFDFGVSRLAVPSQVGDGETVEIRFVLHHIDGCYDSTRYYVRYFPTNGSGRLVYSDSVLQPNDDYRVTSDKFRMYYTALSAGEHTLNFVFSDSFDHSHDLNLTFNGAKDSSAVVLPTTKTLKIPPIMIGVLLFK